MTEEISTCKTNEFGTKIWQNDEGLFHREDGPALEYTDSGKAWWQNGRLHREDGPAIEFPNGHKEWWLHGRELDSLELFLIQGKQKG